MARLALSSSTRTTVVPIASTGRLQPDTPSKIAWGGRAMHTGGKVLIELQSSNRTLAALTRH